MPPLAATGLDLAGLAPPTLNCPRAGQDLQALLLDEAKLLDWAVRLAECWPQIETEFTRLRVLAAAKEFR